MVNTKQNSANNILLLLQVPRTNDKKELAAEQMFASLHGLLTIPSNSIFKSPKRERISLEIAVLKKQIGFYIWVPKQLKQYVEEQVYAQYPAVQIAEVDDYSSNPIAYRTMLVSEMKLNSHDALPIKTFTSFEVDPLAAITATLAQFKDDEEAWIQVIIRPAPADWHRRSEVYRSRLRNSPPNNVLGMFMAVPNSVNGQKIKPKDFQNTRATAAELKSHKLAFEACLRIVYRGNEPADQARLRVQSIIASYKQFSSTYLNGFEAKKIINDPYIMLLYRARDFNKTSFVCNIEEIATLFHLPHTNVETPNVKWAMSHTAEPPVNLPLVTSEYDIKLSPVATTNFRGRNTMFGLLRNDRSRHLYILGQTGVGKSGLLELLTISDIHSPHGFAVIDPHGDYALNILKRIPKERLKDVIYFNPSDVNFPVAFNPMEVYDAKLKTHTCSELIGVLKRMFDSWGPRLEYILRFSILALLDYPGTTMLDITRILTDKDFRDQVIPYIKDPVVRNFWTIEFASWSNRFAAEAVSPVLNKIGAFTANPLVRNIIGQSNSSFNIRKVMDEHKILIVNLSRGLVGEDNAALLGALLVTKIQLAAMSRADIPAEQRLPFYLYVDEFQNFATDSFTTILSEARKYGLNLTVANQYISQMMPNVRDAIFGNVGSIISFRTSASDARSMQRYFEPKINDNDLVQMHNRHFVISMTVNGEKASAFSAISLNLPDIIYDNSLDIIEHSRSKYAVGIKQIERLVDERYQKVKDALVSTAIVKPSRQATKAIVSHGLNAGGVKKASIKQLKTKKPKALSISSVAQPASVVSEMAELFNGHVINLH